MTELLELRTKTLLVYLLCFRTLLPELYFPCDFDLIYITTMKKGKGGGNGRGKGGGGEEERKEGNDKRKRKQELLGTRIWTVVFKKSLLHCFI